MSNRIIKTLTGAILNASTALTGNEPPTVYRGANLFLRGLQGQPYFEVSEGHKNLGENYNLASTALTGTINYTNGSAIVEGNNTDFVNELHPGQLIVSGFEVFCVKEVTDATHFVSYRAAGSTQSGQAAYRLPQLFEINKKRGVLLTGSAVEFEKGHIIAAGSGMLYINGSTIGRTAVRTAASATDVNTTTDTITSISHGFSNGMRLAYTAGTGAIGGLTSGASYFVVGATHNTFKLALTPVGGAVIDLTSTGAGTQTFTLEEVFTASSRPQAAIFRPATNNYAIHTLGFSQAPPVPTITMIPAGKKGMVEQNKHSFMVSYWTGSPEGTDGYSNPSDAIKLDATGNPLRINRTPAEDLDKFRFDFTPSLVGMPSNAKGFIIWASPAGQKSVTTGAATISIVSPNETNYENGPWYRVAKLLTSELVAATAEIPPSNPKGLKGEYFNNLTHSGSPAFERIDNQINFGNSFIDPPNVSSDDGFSIKWTGFITPKYTQTYTFNVFHDNSVELRVNGTLILTNTAPGTHNSSTIVLTADIAVPIEIKLVQNANVYPPPPNDDGSPLSNPWGCVLKWSSTGAPPSQQTLEVVPNSQLTYQSAPGITTNGLFYELDYLDDDLYELVTGNNDRPPHCEFVTQAEGRPLYVSCFGKATTIKTDGGNPGPCVVLGKFGNPDAAPTEWRASVPNDIIGVLDGVGRWFLMTSKSLYYTESTGLLGQSFQGTLNLELPIISRLYWATGATNRYSITLIDDTLYGFSGGKIVQSIGNGDENVKKYEFGAPVEDITRKFNPGFVYVAHDSKNAQVCFIHSASHKNPQNFWCSTILIYSLFGNAWLPLQILSDPGQDMIVSGVAVVDGRLEFLAGGRQFGGTYQTRTYRFDDPDPNLNSMPWYLLWQPSDDGQEEMSKQIHSLRPSGVFSSMKMQIHGARPGGIIKIEDMEAGTGSLSGDITFSDSDEITRYLKRQIKCRNLGIYAVRVSGNWGGPAAIGKKDRLDEIAVELSIHGRAR